VQIVDPTGVLPAVVSSEGAWKLDLRGQTLGVLWNGKPNADNLFREIERRLKASYGVADSIWVDKLAMGQGPGMPATEEMFGRLTSGAIAVLTGSGD
jgi:hypothetical protein